MYVLASNQLSLKLENNLLSTYQTKLDPIETVRARRLICTKITVRRSGHPWRESGSNIVYSKMIPSIVILYCTVPKTQDKQHMLTNWTLVPIPWPMTMVAPPKSEKWSQFRWIFIRCIFLPFWEKLRMVQRRSAVSWPCWMKRSMGRSFFL